MPLVKPGRRGKQVIQEPEDLPESQNLLISSRIWEKVRHRRPRGFYRVTRLPLISARKSGIFFAKQSAISADSVKQDVYSSVCALFASVGATLVVAHVTARISLIDIAGPYREPVLAEC